MQPVNRRTGERAKKEWWPRYYRRKPSKKRVCVSWPVPCAYSVWTITGYAAPGVPNSRVIESRRGGGWWDTTVFTPGPMALLDVCKKALEDQVDIDTAIRCATAAGLFRRSPS